LEAENAAETFFVEISVSENPADVKIAACGEGAAVICCCLAQQSDERCCGSLCLAAEAPFCCCN